MTDRILGTVGIIAFAAIVISFMYLVSTPVYSCYRAGQWNNDSDKQGNPIYSCSDKNGSHLQVVVNGKIVKL